LNQMGDNGNILQVRVGGWLTRLHALLMTTLREAAVIPEGLMQCGGSDAPAV
jgi:hypothetical protein